MSKKILLADDSVTIQKVIAITLASEDYALTVVGDGDTAVSKARELRPDLVIADVAMPGKSGYEVCDLLKKDAALKGTPVLLLAGTFEPLNKAEASRVGADDSIIKPFESQELLDKIARLVAGAPGGVEAARPAAPVQRPAPPSARPAAEPRRPEAPRDYGHLSVEEEIAPPDVDKPDLLVSDEHWEPGDFLGFPEAAEGKKEAAEAGDEEVIGEGVTITPAPPAEPKASKADDLSAAVAEFTDLEFPEDEFREKAAPARPAAEPIEAVGQAEPEPFDLSAFEVEPFKAEPTRAEPPRAVKEERAQRPPAEPVERGAVIEVSETEEIEEEAVPAAQPEPPRAAQATVEPRPSAWREAERPAPPSREAASQPAPEPVRPVELVERAAAVSVPPPAPQPAPPVARQTVAPQPPAAPAAPQAPMLSEEQVAEIVRKTAREIIERIAWDIVPELAEEFIKVEMKRVRDAIADKFKAGG